MVREKFYSYNNYISQNRLSNTNNIALINHVDFISEEVCYLNTGDILPIKTVVEQVINCQLKLKNPQILKRWYFFDNGKFIVDTSLYLQYIGEEEEEIIPYEYLPYIFNTEYEALLCSVYFTLLNNPLEIKSRYKFGTRNLGKQITRDSINQYNTGIYETKNLRGDLFRLKLETDRTQIFPYSPETYYIVNAKIRCYKRGHLYLQGRRSFAVKPIYEREIMQCRKEGMKLVNNVDTLFR